jgi:hypothetical protein
VEEVEVVVAHHERATLRVGEVFLKIDADQTRTDVEVEAMRYGAGPDSGGPVAEAACARARRSPGVGTRPPRRAVDRVGGGGCRRTVLHDAPLPPWPGRSLDELASHLDGEWEWLVTNGVLPTDVVTRNRRVAEAALGPWTPVFMHVGDLQVAHVFVDVDEITPDHPDYRDDWWSQQCGGCVYWLALAGKLGSDWGSAPAPRHRSMALPGSNTTAAINLHKIRTDSGWRDDHSPLRNSSAFHSPGGSFRESVIPPANLRSYRNRSREDNLSRLPPIT